MLALLKSAAAAVAGFFNLSNLLAGWAKQSSDQNTGAKLQQLTDTTAQVKDAVDAQVAIETSNGLSRDQLIERLHNEGAGRQ